MLLEKNIQKIVLDLLSDSEHKEKIPRKEINSIVNQKFRMNKRLIYLVLKGLEEKGDIELNNHCVVLKHDRLFFQKH